MAKFHIDLTALRAFSKKVDKAIETAKSLDMEPIKEIIMNEMETKFSTGNDDDWKPITATTIRLRPNRLANTPPLGGLTGNLFRSLKLTKARNKNQIIIQFPHPGALSLHYGAPNNTLFGNPAPIPARPFLTLSEETLSEIREEIRRQIKSQFLEK